MERSSISWTGSSEDPGEMTSGKLSKRCWRVMRCPKGPHISGQHLPASSRNHRHTRTTEEPMRAENEVAGVDMELLKLFPECEVRSTGRRTKDRLQEAYANSSVHRGPQGCTMQMPGRRAQFRRTLEVKPKIFQANARNGACRNRELEVTYTQLTSRNPTGS